MKFGRWSVLKVSLVNWIQLRLLALDKLDAIVAPIGQFQDDYRNNKQEKHLKLFKDRKIDDAA